MMQNSAPADSDPMEELARLRAECQSLQEAALLLRGQIEELRSLTPDENPNPVLRIAGDGVLLYANSASRPMLSESGTAVGRLMPRRWREWAAEALAGNKPVIAEVETRDRTVLFDVIPVAQSGHVNAYGTDITELRLAESHTEAALDSLGYSEIEARRQRDLLEHIMEAAPVGISVHRGPNHRVEYVNPPFCRQTRTQRDRIVRKPLVEVFPGVKESGVLAALDQVFRGGKPVSGREVELRDVTGADTYWSYDAVPLILPAAPAPPASEVSPEVGSPDADRSGAEVDSESSRPYGILVLSRDVTDEVLARRQGEEDASRYAQRVSELDAVLAAIPSGVAILGPRGEYLRTNQAARTLLGLSSAYEQASADDRLRLGRYAFSDASSPSGGGRPVTTEDAPVYRALHGETIRNQIIGVERGKSVTWLSISAGPIRGPSGQITGAAVSLADVSELYQTREWLDAAHDQLQLRAEQLGASQERIQDADDELRLKGEQIEASRDEMQEAKDELWLRSGQLRSAQVEVDASAERARQYAAELDAIFSVLPHSLIVFEPDGRIRHSNQAAKELFDLSPSYESSSLDQRLEMRIYAGADGRPWTPDQTPLARALRGEMVHDELMSMRPHAGAPPVWLTVSAAPLLGPGGEIVGAVAAHSDITALHAGAQRQAVSHRAVRRRRRHRP